MSPPRRSRSGLAVIRSMRRVPARLSPLSLQLGAGGCYRDLMTPSALREQDVPAATKLLERVGLAAGAANIGRYLRWQPDGIFGLIDDGRLLGTVSLLQFGDVDFIGCMAVEPAQQGRGLGRMLLEHAHAHGERAGVKTFLLEATPVGAVLYRKLGYVVEHETAIVGRTASRPPAVLRTTGDRASILELDRVATGSPRDKMIGALVDEVGAATVRTGGVVAGYGLFVGERLGPVIARDAGAGRALIDELAAGCSTSTVPLPNEAAFAALGANGFTVVRTLERMRRGPRLASRTDWIWALASAGAG